jgi:hypothetical protein
MDDKHNCNILLTCLYNNEYNDLPSMDNLCKKANEIVTLRNES